MSEMKFKFVIRAHLPQLTGADRATALAYFRPKVGDPDDYFDDSDWWYDHNKNDVCPVAATDSNEWGIDVVLVDVVEESASSGSIDTESLRKIVGDMLESFPEMGSAIITVTGYSWYTGVDEPISFEWAKE